MTPVHVRFFLLDPTCVKTPQVHLNLTTRTVTVEGPDRNSLNQTERSNVFLKQKPITHFPG